MLFERPSSGDRAVLLQVELQQQANPDQQEFAELALSAAIDVAAQIVAKRQAPHARWFVGSGKVDELRSTLRTHHADLLLVNHELSAGQQRNLERSLNCRVITRTELILTIFADRARSHEGQLQVELAQLKHAQTRLVRGWTHLDRQKGGIGMRGAGETQIELDQRMLAERIKATQNKLTQVAKRRQHSRRGRHRRGTPTVVLVGYTNAGKSTLFNRLAGASVEAKDQLFATLDPTMRRIQIAGVGDVVLADTVGFVSQLPHALVEAFKATLEEVSHADLLLHVTDAADPLCTQRMEQVLEVLQDIDAGDIPQILVMNKADLLAQAPVSMGRGHLVSAVTGDGLDELLDGIAQALGVVSPHQVSLSAGDGKTRAWLYASGAVLDEQVTENGIVQLTVQADSALLEEMRDHPHIQVEALVKTEQMPSSACLAPAWGHP